MVVTGVSDWLQSVPLQLLSDTIEHTLHSVGGGGQHVQQLVCVYEWVTVTTINL